LVASLSIIDKSVAAALGQAGADGIELLVRKEADLEKLRSLLPDLPIPVGIVLDAESGWVPASPGELPDIDWVRLSFRASAVALAWEKPARFITIPDDLELRRVPALNMLEVDAVVIEGTWFETGELSIEDALRLAALGDILKKPVFINADQGLSADLVSVAKQCGVNGLLYQVGSAASVAMLAAYIKALEANASGG
jgi:hypothetical protein